MNIANTPASTEATTSSRRDEIVDTTFELVRERGFAGLRMRLIADRIGVTEAALYRHFPSKESILLALVDRMERRLLGPVRRIALRDDLVPAEKLEEILRHHLGTVIEARSLPLLLISEASFSRYDELHDRMRGIVTSYFGVLESIAEQAKTPNGLRPKEIAVLLLGLPAGLALRQRLQPDEELAARLTGAVVHDHIQQLLGA